MLWNVVLNSKTSGDPRPPKTGTLMKSIPSNTLYRAVSLQVYPILVRVRLYSHPTTRWSSFASPSLLPNTLHLTYHSTHGTILPELRAISIHLYPLPLLRPTLSTMHPPFRKRDYLSHRISHITQAFLALVPSGRSGSTPSYLKFLDLWLVTPTSRVVTNRHSSSISHHCGRRKEESPRCRSK